MIEVYFEVKVLLSGVNETRFRAKWDENTEVVRMAIKSLVPGLTHKKYIDVLNITDETSTVLNPFNTVKLMNSGIYSAEDGLFFSRILTSSYVILHVQIGTIIPSVDRDSSIASSMYNYLSSNITARINDGSLQTKIRAFSNANSGILGLVAVANSKIASTFESIMLRSPLPTSSPTGMPTCGIGSFGAPGDCGPCPPGRYTDQYNQIKCQLCPVGTYSTTYDAEFCLDCPWPRWSCFPGSTECSGYYLNTSDTVYYGTMFFLVLVFLVCLSFGGEYKVPAFAIMLFPTMDILSDLAYIMTSIYYDKYVFLSSVFFFIAPNFLWFFKVYEMKAYPCFYIPFPGYLFINENIVFLWSEHGIPTINGDRCKGIPTKWEKIDSVGRFLLVLPFWLYYIPLQLVMYGLLVVWIILHSPFLIFWGGIGIFLFQCKVLSIAVVWNIWFLGWVGPSRWPNYYKHIKLDTAILNESLFAEFISETLPQLGLQSFNNALTNTFSTVGIFSSALSVTIAFNGLYRYGYYTVYKGLKIGEVPTENFAAVAIGVKLDPDAEDVAGRSELDVSKLLDKKRTVLYPTLDSGMIMHPEEIAFLLLLYQCNKQINKWLLWNNILNPTRLLECRLVKLKNVIKLIDDEEFSTDITILVNSFKDRIQEKGNSEDADAQVSVWELLLNMLDRDVIVFLFRNNILSPDQLYYASSDTLAVILGLVTNPKKKAVVGKYFSDFPAVRQSDARERMINGVVKDQYFNEYEDAVLAEKEEDGIFSDVSDSESDSDSDSDEKKVKPTAVDAPSKAPVPTKAVDPANDDIRDDLSVTSATSLDCEPSFLRDIDDITAAAKQSKGWLW